MLLKRPLVGTLGFTGGAEDAGFWVKIPRIAMVSESVQPRNELGRVFCGIGGMVSNNESRSDSNRFEKGKSGATAQETGTSHGE